jgi:hypothetical protein
MIMARFVYKNHVYGQWTVADPSNPVMVPNPSHASKLLGVEFKETDNEVKPSRLRGRAHRMSTAPNGEVGTSQPHISQVTNPDEYATRVNAFSTVQLRIEMMLRESRYITDQFPPYSSGAGDLVEHLLEELRVEWENLNR